jgi:acyltransferase
MTQKLNRIYWVDNLRAFVILMVMLAHMEAQTNFYLRVYLFNITMPLFVSISGFLFRPEKYQGPKEFITRKFSTLMIPYFFFSFMAYGMLLLVDNCIEGIPLTFANVLKALLWIADGNWFYIRFAYNPALWFLPYLFLIEVEFYFLSKLNKSFQVLVLVPLYALGIVLGRQIEHLPWTFAGSLVGLLFYWFGFLIKENISLLETRYKPIIILLSGIISIIFCYSNLPFGGGPGLDGYGENSLFFALSNLAGIIFFFTLTNYTRPNRMLSYIGANTIIVFAFSQPLLFLFPRLIAFFKLEIVYSLIPVSPNDRLNPIIAGLNNILWILLAIAMQLIIISFLIPIFNKKLHFVLGREKPN